MSCSPEALGGTGISMLRAWGPLPPLPAQPPPEGSESCSSHTQGLCTLHSPRQNPPAPTAAWAPGWGLTSSAPSMTFLPAQPLVSGCPVSSHQGRGSTAAMCSQGITVRLALGHRLDKMATTWQLAWGTWGNGATRGFVSESLPARLMVRERARSLSLAGCCRPQVGS